MTTHYLKLPCLRYGGMTTHYLKLQCLRYGGMTTHYLKLQCLRYGGMKTHYLKLQCLRYGGMTTHYLKLQCLRYGGMTTHYLKLQCLRYGGMITHYLKLQCLRYGGMTTHYLKLQCLRYGGMTTHYLKLQCLLCLLSLLAMGDQDGFQDRDFWFEEANAALKRRLSLSIGERCGAPSWGRTGSGYTHGSEDLQGAAAGTTGGEQPPGVGEVLCSRVNKALAILTFKNQFVIHLWQVVMGGGRRHWLPKVSRDTEEPSLEGRRLDGRNLIEDWVRDKRRRGLKAE
ncbi:hypothetical protein J6590_095253 [Homalodisca vitripennis]|nr:hypothetical protein J6590_095253 [Homalodisca vitripennis]